MRDNLPEEGTIPINGSHLYYRDWGGQGRSLILLHGLASHSSIWDLVAPLLARQVRVQALDLRGHGKSGKPDHGYDFDTVADDVRQFWEEQGLANPTLVGHSWGGNVALHCAVSYPDQVAGLVLVDGGFIEPSARPDLTWERAEVEMAPPSFEGITLDEIKDRIKQGNLAPYWSADIERIVSSNFYVDVDGYAKPHLSRENHMKIVRALWEHKPSKLDSRVQCPALVLAASGSPRGNPMEQVRAKLVSQAEALLPRGRVIWMEDTIHDIPLQRPRELADLILSFIKRLA